VHDLNTSVLGTLAFLLSLSFAAQPADLISSCLSSLDLRLLVGKANFESGKDETKRGMEEEVETWRLGDEERQTKPPPMSA
jgi:hypothetical protein